MEERERAGGRDEQRVNAFGSESAGRVVNGEEKSEREREREK